MGAIFILLAVGSLIGTWNMAGTIPTVVYYGLGILQPTFFYLSTVLICGARRAHDRQLLDDRRDARRGVRGARPAARCRSGDHRRRGDLRAPTSAIKLTPLSETTVLVPSMVGGVTVNEHVGAMIWTSGPAIVDRARPVHGARARHPARRRRASIRPQAQATLAGEFNITPAQPAAARSCSSSSRSGGCRRSCRSSPVRSSQACWPGSRSLQLVAGVRRRDGRSARDQASRRIYSGDGQRVRVDQRAFRRSTRSSLAAACRRCCSRSG